MNRRKPAIAFVVAVVLASFGGWLLGSQVTSPAEIAARTAAPQPSPILAPVEARVLSSNVVTRGTGRFGAPREVGPAHSLLKGDTIVLTGRPELGDQASEGDILYWISGRPVILLEGDQPSFRDLGPGMTGTDVAQLEAALERLGHEPGAVDGVYDDQTEAAVRLLYESVGIDPAVASAQQLSDLFPSGTDIFAGSIPGPGVLLPADEILFLPALPVRVAEVSVGLGEPIDGPVLTVTDANVSIDGSLPIEQSGLAAVGMTVLIDESDLGIEAVGVISSLAEAPGTDGLDGFHVYFEVTVEDPPQNLVNASVRLTIPVESTSDAVLVVPITALTLALDGSSQVQRDRDGVLESVVVRPGLSAQGLVEVEAIDGDLTAGDLVLIGFEAPLKGPETANG